MIYPKDSTHGSHAVLLEFSSIYVYARERTDRISPRNYGLGEAIRRGIE